MADINAAVYKAALANARKTYEAQKKWLEQELAGKGVRSKCEGYISKIEKVIADNDEAFQGGGEEGAALLAEITEYLEDAQGRLDSVALLVEIKAVLDKAEFQLKWANTYLDQGKQSQADSAYEKLKDIVSPIIDNTKYAKVDIFVDFSARYAELQGRMGDHQAAAQEAAAQAAAEKESAKAAKTTAVPTPKSAPTPSPVKATPTPSKPVASAPVKAAPIKKSADYRKNDIQLNNAKGVITRMFSQADTSIRRGEIGQAMQIMQSVRQSLEELKEKHQDCTPGKLEDAVADIESRMEKFNDSFYREQRTSESRPLISDMSFGTSNFEHCVKQGKYDDALVAAERFKKGVVAIHEHELELLKDANIKSLYDSHFLNYVKMIESLEETLEKEKRSRYGDQGTGLDTIIETIKTDPRYSVSEYMPRDENADEINAHLQVVKLDWTRLADTLLTDNLRLKKVILSPTDNPAFMATSQIFNKICGFIENDLNKIRAQCDILSATDFMAVKEVHTEVKGVARVHQMNIDQIESNIIRPLNQHKDDATARKMWLPAKVFVAQWKQVTVPKMRAIGDIINAIAFCKYSINSLDSIMVECEKRIPKGSLPTTRSVNFTTNDGWVGPDFGQLTMHDDGEEYEYKDYELAEYVARKCDRLTDSLIVTLSAEFDCFPGAEQMKDQISAIKSRAIKWHALNALRGLCTAGREHRATYWNALRRYPVARGVAGHRLLAYKMKHYERQLYNLPEDVEFSENATDPFVGQTITDAHDSERIEWYQKPLRIVPNSLQEDDSAPVCGKIYFGKNYINEGDPDFAHRCTDKFTIGDDIHARAFWPRLIKDFAVARDRSTGKLLKGPQQVQGQFTVELLMFAYLDDVALERKGQPLKSFSWYSDGADGTSSLYSAKKSVDFVVQRNDKYEYNGSVHTDWDLIAQRVSLELLRRDIKSGEHKLRFEICYRIVAASLFPPEPTFFDFDTPVSLPIAKGEMILVVNRKPILHDILPKNFRNEAEVSRLQSVIKSDMDSRSSFGAVGKNQQAVIAVAVKSDMFPMWEKEIEEVEGVMEVRDGGRYLGEMKTKTYKTIDVCYRWGLSFQSACYLSPSVGWNHESVKFFTHTAMTPNPNERTTIAPNKPSMPPITAIDSREQIEFEADLLPPNVLHDAKIKRFEGDEDAKSGLGAVDFTHVDMFNTISDQE